MVQTHPFTFARQGSPRDHLSRGRIAARVVTWSQTNTEGPSLGYGGLPAHDERYDHANEYLEVAYDKVAAVSLTGLQL